MPMNDWNHDGKKDGFDNFIEYQIYEDTTKNSTDTSDNHAKRCNSSQQSMSALGVILCIFSGLFWQALLFTLINIDIDKLSSILIIILWIVFSSITTGIVNSTKKK